MAEFTKGEWKICKHGLKSEIYVDTPNRPRAKEYQIAEGIYKLANAHLIAASPKLYRCCKRLAELLRVSLAISGEAWQAEIEDLNEALNLAKGKG